MRNSLLIAISFVVGWLLLNSIAAKFRPSDMYFVNDFRKISETEKCNIILGNSRSLSALDVGTIESHFNTPTLHLGYSSADMLTQQTIFRHALQRIEHVEQLFLEISPFHFDNRRVSTHDIVHVLIRRNPILICSPSLIHLEFIQELFPNSETLRRIKNIFSKWPYSDYSERNFCEEANSSVDIELSIEELRQVFDDKTIQFEQEAQLYLLDLLQLCRENSIKVVVLLTPSSDSFQSGLTNYEEYKVVLSSLLKTFPEVTVIDADRVENQKYLGDPDHVACPEKFTREVIIPRLAD